MAEHRCHADGCTVVVPPRMLTCSRHWKLVPRALQLEVYRHFNPAQCQAARPRPLPSIEWMVASDLALAAVARAEGRAAAAARFELAAARARRIGQMRDAAAAPQLALALGGNDDDGV